MNNYHIYEEVGRGKYSVVYKGRIKKSIKYVAVKSVERSRRKKLMNEVRMLQEIEHPNIVKFYSSQETRNHLWIVFEYCPGGDLIQILEQDKRLPEPTVQKFGYDLIEGLSYLHAQGIIYADLKPHSVMLNEYGSLKYCDFGLAKKISDYLNDPSSRDNMMEAGKPKAGTPYYMAPELFQDTGVHTFYSDFWALGCVLYELATGKPPFCTSSLKDLISLIVESDFPRVEGYSVEFNDLLKKCLEKDPLKRINWEELKNHEFWKLHDKNYEFTKRLYPLQPQFDQYLRSRGIVPEHFYTMRNNPLAKKLAIQQQQQSAFGQVDILRLSHNVRKNMKKDEDVMGGAEEMIVSGNLVEQQAQRPYSKASNSQVQPQIISNPQLSQQQESNDVNLKCRKMVLNFGERDDEDDSSSAGGNTPTDQFKQITGSGSTTPSSNSYHSQNAFGQQIQNQNVGSHLQEIKNNVKSIFEKQRGSNSPPIQAKKIDQNLIDMLDDQHQPGAFLDNIKVQGASTTTKKPNHMGSKTQPLTQQQSKQPAIPKIIHPRTPQVLANLQLLINKTLFQQSSKQNAGSKGVEQLLIHNSDNAVKPIIGNKEIERQVANEATYDPQLLPFEAWTPDQVLQALETPQIEPLLSALYNAINQNTNLQAKVQSLLYFESIIINSSVSNRLINSAFMELLLKNLRTLKTPQIRLRICSVIGLMVRHSTVIENEVAESELFPLLVEAVKDKSDQVRKKAIAALGEYMFYAATQMDDEQAEPCWEIPEEAIAIIVKSLREGEDETVRFYACKTLENITAQSQSAGGRFASLESAQSLLTLFLTPPQSSLNENLRTSSAVALCNLVRLQPKLFQPVFQRLTPKVFCYTLSESQSKVQQAFVTMLNQALWQGGLGVRVGEVMLQEGEAFLRGLVKLLEHHSIVLRGKVLLTFLLLFKLDFRWLSLVSDPDIKFFHVVDRLARDNYKYVQCCLQCLVEGVVEVVPQVLGLISEDLNIMLNGGKSSSIPSEFDKRLSARTEFDQLKGNNLVFIAIILDLQQAQALKNKLIGPQFIRAISILIENLPPLGQAQVFPGSDEFLNALLLITESMNQNQKVLLQMHEPMLQFMLPVLLDKIKSSGGVPQAAGADIRFLSLKIFTDIIVQYLNDDSIYDPFSANPVPNTTVLISDLLSRQLFPLFPQIFRDNDPVPIFGLKLLSAMLEINPSFTNQLRKHQLYEELMENYQVGHPRLNRHTMNIVKIIIQSKEIGLVELQQLKIVEKTTMILKNMVQIKQDWCTEIVLEIINEVLTQLISVAKETDVSILAEELYNNFDQCVNLLLPQQNEPTIIERASHCLIQMLQLYASSPVKRRDIYFVEHHLSQLITALKTDKKLVQKRVLKCIYWALIQGEYAIKVKSERRQALEREIANIIQTDDKSIVNTCREILKILNAGQVPEFQQYDYQQQHQQQQYFQQQQQPQLINFYQPMNGGGMMK